MEQHDLNGARFEGRVEAKLEDIGTTLLEIKEKMKDLDKCVSSMKVKVAAIGGTISLVVTIVILLITKHL